MPFIPHTESDVRAMLETIGVSSIETLFEEIPPSLRLSEAPRIPSALTEQELVRLMRGRSAQYGEILNFIGAGAYEHHIPAAVWQIATRGEFYTAYTPYQPEASQGSLQLIYEYQSMMAALTAMDASNASLYDGASGLAEAILMAVRVNRRSTSKRVLVPASVHPAYRATAHAIVHHQGIVLEELPFDPKSGRTSLDALKAYDNEDITALVIPQPNFFGMLEEMDELSVWAQRKGVTLIALVNPMSLAVLKPPGEWGEGGVDIVCGEGQPFGTPLSSGGPYFGFMCCKTAHLRQLPGRLVGRTVDADGKRGFVLTLQAREQHIRRSKATSNICTNQGLVVTAATIHLALLGPDGLRRVAAASCANTHALVNQLTALPGVRPLFTGDYFHEAALAFDRPVRPLLDALAERGILGGYALTQDYPLLGESVLVCATETKADEDLARYAQELGSLLQSAA